MRYFSFVLIFISLLILGLGIYLLAIEDYLSGGIILSVGILTIVIAGVLENEKRNPNRFCSRISSTTSNINWHETNNNEYIY